MKQMGGAHLRYFAKSEAFAKEPEGGAHLRYFAKSEAFAKGPHRRITQGQQTTSDKGDGCERRAQKK